MFAHEQAANSIEHARELSKTRFFWWINYLSDYTDLDFSWEPVPWENQYTHTWPSQWHEYSGTFLVPKNSTEINYKFHTEIVPNQTRTENYKILIPNANFDFSWAPHPMDPPYIYVFGNQWWPANKMPTIEYHVPGAVERKFMHVQATLPTQHSKHWHTLENCIMDYSWVPDPGDPPYIYVFGNQWHCAEIMPTVEYHVEGATERKFMYYPRAQLVVDNTLWQVPTGIDPNHLDFSWKPDPGSPPYIYQFGTQWQKTGGPQYVMTGATEVKYLPTPRFTKISQDDFWIVPDGADVDSFDWTWHPDSTEEPYIYQFGTQHQRTGGPQYIVPGATEIKYIDQIKIKTERVATAIYEIDHMDGNAGTIDTAIKTVRYFDNYLDTLRRLAKNIGDKHEFVWICSSVCDYTNFDFSWHPEVWQATMLHVFPSDGEKFGDTFFMHVPTFQYRADKCQLLEWYDLNFTDISVPRRPLPIITHNYDTQVEAIKVNDWSGPLALFTIGGEISEIPTVPLWREKTKTIVPLSLGASQVIVPKVAIPYIKTQVYDYPYIDKKQKHVGADHPLDVVFISNGESNAESNYKYLALNKGITNSRLVRVDRVNGRASAYRAAAEASNTPWFFAVFAKLEVQHDFNFMWQPDRLQQPKHYIFHAKNPANNLEYGHMAIIAYNKKLVLENTAPGLDFTLDQEHEVVPILSGIAYYNDSDWMCWRTAFRECIKLKYSLPNVENEYRLNQWLTVDTTPNKWSMKGALDAVEYYNTVSGDFIELKKSYDWDWLATYAFVKWNLTPDQ